MKRKETILEQKLLENGYTLTGKRYKGKHSQLTECYEYSKKAFITVNEEIIETQFFIFIDSKRVSIYDHFFLCDFNAIGEIEIKQLNHINGVLMNEIAHCIYYDDSEA